MTTEYDKTIGAEIIDSFGSRPEMLVQVLQTFITRFSFLNEDAMRQIALGLNLSRAEVWGCIKFYHDFRTEAPGKTVVKICQAEACQAMGSRELTAYAEKALGIPMHSSSDDGKHTLEPVYCLGNCACSPAVMIDEKVYGRVDPSRLDALIESADAK